MTAAMRIRGKRPIDADAAIEGLQRLQNAARPQGYFDAFPSAALAHSHVFFWLSVVTLRRDRLLARAFKRFGVRVGEWRVLSSIKMRPNMTMGELAELAIFDPTTLTRSVDHMVRQGWVKRSPDPQDMRVTRVSLLPAGSELFKKLFAIGDRINQEVCDFLPPGTPQLVCLALREMLRGLEHIDKADQTTKVEAGNGATRSAA